MSRVAHSRPKESSEKRSAVMRAVKSENTAPERSVRSMLHRLGYRYRLYDKSLPGAPDLVFAGRHKTIFVQGCFWHGHSCKRGARTPKTNRAYWVRKISRNVARDSRTARELRALGWEVLYVWECNLKRPDQLARRILRFLGRPGAVNASQLPNRKSLE